MSARESSRFAWTAKGLETVTRVSKPCRWQRSCRWVVTPAAGLRVRTGSFRLTCAEEEETQERKSRNCSGEKSPGQGDDDIVPGNTLTGRQASGGIGTFARRYAGRQPSGTKPHIPQERKQRDADETNRSVPVVAENLERRWSFERMIRYD